MTGALEACTRKEQHAVNCFLGNEVEKFAVWGHLCHFSRYMNGMKSLKVECQIWLMQLTLPGITVKTPDSNTEVG